jgi:glycosyltransferase involved in cell wall biosynthesis
MTSTKINPENFIKWTLRRTDSLESIVFLFASKVNANNARYLPLFEATEYIRVVIFNGLPIRYTDLVSFRVFNFLKWLFRKKINRYKIIHFFNPQNNYSNLIQVLHVDDPSYDSNEVIKLNNWENKLVKKRFTPLIVCTNKYTSNWLRSNTKYSEVFIIEQGFHNLEISGENSEKDFICCYSAPYINYGRDKNSLHTSYGAQVLIEEIIPELYSRDRTIQLHIIGRVGKCAKKALRNYNNIKYFGLISPEKNIQVLKDCSIGLYPRKYDNKRSVLKIFTYMGAGLPVVTFDLIDTEIIKKENLGYSVKCSKEFVDKIIDLKSSPETLKHFKKNINSVRVNYDWKILAKKMETLIWKASIR